MGVGGAVRSAVVSPSTRSPSPLAPLPATGAGGLLRRAAPSPNESAFPASQLVCNLPSPTPQTALTLTIRAAASRVPSCPANAPHTASAAPSSQCSQPPISWDSFDCTTWLGRTPLGASGEMEVWLVAKLGAADDWTSHLVRGKRPPNPNPTPDPPAPGMSASFLPPLQEWMGQLFQLLAKPMMEPPWAVMSPSSPMYTWGRGIRGCSLARLRR